MVDSYGATANVPRPRSSSKAAVDLIVHFFTLPLDIFHIPHFLKDIDFQRDWKRAVFAVIMCQICGPFVFLLMLFLGFLGFYVAIIQLIEPFLIRNQCLKRSLRQAFEELSVIMFEDHEIDDISHGYVPIPDIPMIPGPSMSTDQFTNTFQHRPSEVTLDLPNEAKLSITPRNSLVPTSDELYTESLRENSISRNLTEDDSVDNTSQTGLQVAENSNQNHQKTGFHQIEIQPEVNDQGPKQEYEIHESVANKFLNSSKQQQSASERTRRSSAEYLTTRDEMANLEQSRVVTKNREKIIQSSVNALNTKTPERKVVNLPSPNGNVRAKASLFQNQAAI